MPPPDQRDFVRAPRQVLRRLDTLFDVGEVIAIGGSSVVHRAIRRADGAAVALKIVEFDSDQAGRRWTREVGSLRRVQHPLVAGLVSFGIVRGTGFAYVGTRYVGGPTLERWLSSTECVDRAFGCQLVMQILEALAVVHEAGLAHRDVKSENIVLDAENQGRPVLLDFGIAHAYGSDETTWTRLTHPGSVIGTADYVAPERIKGALGDAKSDIWSVGVLLHRILYGHLPFRARTPSLTILRAVSDPIAPPWRDARDVTSVELRLFEIVATALEKAPERRFCDAANMAAALHRALPHGAPFPSRSFVARTRDEDTRPL